MILMSCHDSAAAGCSPPAAFSTIPTAASPTSTASGPCFSCSPSTTTAAISRPSVSSSVGAPTCSPPSAGCWPSATAFSSPACFCTSLSTSPRAEVSPSPAGPASPPPPPAPTSSTPSKRTPIFSRNAAFSAARASSSYRGVRQGPPSTRSSSSTPRVFTHSPSRIFSCLRIELIANACSSSVSIEVGRAKCPPETCRPSKACSTLTRGSIRARWFSRSSTMCRRRSMSGNAFSVGVTGTAMYTIFRSGCTPGFLRGTFKACSPRIFVATNTSLAEQPSVKSRCPAEITTQSGSRLCTRVRIPGAHFPLTSRCQCSNTDCARSCADRRKCEPSCTSTYFTLSNEKWSSALPKFALFTPPAFDGFDVPP
mmetsp:Transcript_21557/g.54387  ORF Transcript_21557/g.54387 Transcript_21557/m.54387 type:complete len:368 (+) Transcript_21557:410-1513(+)